MTKGVIGIPTDWKPGDEVLRSQFMGDVYSPEQRSINLQEVHKTLTGKGVIVGVGDTGWVNNHPDLKKPIATQDMYRGEGLDQTLHGTHVTGIINMQLNGKGMVGVAPGADMVLAKVLTGLQGTGTYQAIAGGVRWMADKGCNLINLSLGADANSNSTELNQAINYAYSKGCYCIVASGNENSNRVGYPANLPNVIAIGAVDLSKALAFFSNKGVKLDAVSYGVDIISTGRNGNYYRSSGTSMACPFATGLIALYWEWFKKENNRDPKFADIYTWIRQCSIDLGDQGFDKHTGYGLISTDFKCFENVSKPEPEPTPEPKPVTDVKDIEIEALRSQVKSLKSTINILVNEISTAPNVWWKRKRYNFLRKLNLI